MVVYKDCAHHGPQGSVARVHLGLDADEASVGAGGGAPQCIVKSAGGAYNRGAVLLCAVDGAVSPGPLTANSASVGYAMETITVTAGTGILCYIKAVLMR